VNKRAHSLALAHFMPPEFFEIRIHSGARFLPVFENDRVSPVRRSTARMTADFNAAVLVLLSQKVAFWELGILDNFGRFVFRQEELRWITQ
jgi:hypothetical protein